MHQKDPPSAYTGMDFSQYTNCVLSTQDLCTETWPPREEPAVQPDGLADWLGVPRWKAQLLSFPILYAVASQYSCSSCSSVPKF